MLKRQAKALIRLRVCAVWSEPLLVAHNTMLEIACRGSIIVKYQSLVHGNFVWEIHVRYRRGVYNACVERIEDHHLASRCLQVIKNGDFSIHLSQRL